MLAILILFTLLGQVPLPASAAPEGLSPADWSQIQLLLPSDATPVQDAYLKTSNTGAGDMFGFSVAISGDTAVVGAWRESSAAKGVNGDQSDNSAADAGAAYVFVRATDGSWSQQAYLKASNTDAGDRFGWSVDISGDTIVVGAFQEASSATGVNGDQTINSFSPSGAAYVFFRSGTSWSQQAYLKATTYKNWANFGISVAVDGERVVVGDPGSNTSYVFARSGTGWAAQASLQGANSEAGDAFGDAVDISADTIVVGAYAEKSAGAQTPSDNSLTRPGAAYVFTYSDSAWSQQAYLKASNPGITDQFGIAVAISADTIVVGARFEESQATGVNGDQVDNSLPAAGAAYVFVRSGSSWSQQAYLKASNTGPGDYFGESVAISGDRIVIGSSWEDSNATGINGLQSNNENSSSGASYLFLRKGTSWSQHAYLKASNSDVNDSFGISVALDQDTIMVGGDGEDSSLTGVNASPDNNLAAGAGAAYVFVVPPLMQGFTRQDPLSDHTNADALVFHVGFNVPVQHVDLTDFKVNSTSTAEITAVNSVDTQNYEVSVSGGDLAGYNGTVGLNLANSHDISDLAGIQLTTAEPAVDQVYILDNNAPSIYSSKRADPNPTDANQVTFTVTFTEAVSGVAEGDFSLTSLSLSAAAITAISGSGAVYTVTVDTGTGSGYLRLNVPNTASITDLAGNSPSGLPYNVGQTYTIDKTGPSVSSVTRAAANPSSADSLVFTVLFSEPVMDVDADDFSLVVSGLSGSAVQSVTGSGRIYTVNLDPGYGSGTLRLDLPDTASFTDLNGNLQISLPYTSGESYTVNRLPASFNKTSPAAGATTGPSPTLNWAASSLAVDGYEYCLVVSTASCSTWTSVAGTSQALGPLSSGSYKWQVRALNPGGQTYANGAAGTTWSFTVDATKPVVSSVALADPNPNTAASLRYTVIFSENVTGVNSADFGLTATGVTGAAVAGVTGSGKVYTVTVSTGSGTGTLRLDVKADGTILDVVGNALSAAYSSGPKYTLDRLNTFTSTAANDGWVLESTETSNTGGTLNSTLNLVVGDSATKQQYRSILSFDTSGLPDNATIVRVTLKLHKLSGTGANPFASFQGLQVDIRQGFFGSALTLQTTDFGFAPSLASVGTVTQIAGLTTEYQSVLLNSAWPFVSKTASTQLRLAFKLDDNNNAVADTVSFASGNHLTAAYRPVLLVEYTLP